MARSAESFITDAAGRKRAVIISIARYRRIMEDMHDLQILAQRRNEGTISFNKLKKRLRGDGVL